MITALISIMIIMLSVPTFEQNLASQLISPCPDRFQYDTQQTDEGNIFGYLLLLSERALDSQILKFMLEAQEQSDDVSIDNIPTIDDVQIKSDIRSLKPNMPAFFPVHIKYRSKEMLRIILIEFDGEDICKEDKQSITTTYRPPWMLSFGKYRPSEIRKPSRKKPEITILVTLGSGYKSIIETEDCRTIQEMLLPSSSDQQEGSDGNLLQSSGSITTSCSGSVFKGMASVVTESRGINSWSFKGTSSPEGNVQEQPQKNSQFNLFNNQIKPTEGNSRTKPQSSQRTWRPPSAGKYEYIGQQQTQSQITLNNDQPKPIGSTSLDKPQQYETTDFRYNEQCGISDYKERLSNPLVYGGLGANLKDWPWQVALYNDYGMNTPAKFSCGGTLVSKRDVIIAAHCVTQPATGELYDVNYFTIYLGKVNLYTSKKGVQVRYVDSVAVHPKFDPVTYTYDLAILKLDDVVPFTDQIRPACIWPENDTAIWNIIDKTGVITGWGVDESGSMSPTLQTLKVPIIDPLVCVLSYPEFFSIYINEATPALCAGWRNGSSPCNGDSGGGLVLKLGNRWYLRGVVSISASDRNTGLCDPKHYTVFTDVALLLDWVKENIENITI